jgi:hypothetical protein
MNELNIWFVFVHPVLIDGVAVYMESPIASAALRANACASKIQKLFENLFVKLEKASVLFCAHFLEGSIECNCTLLTSIPSTSHHPDPTKSEKISLFTKRCYPLYYPFDSIAANT